MQDESDAEPGADVLIVDNDDRIVELVAWFLRKRGYRVRTGLSLTFGLENLTNEDYRVHGSGLNRPGTSLYAGLAWSF